MTSSTSDSLNGPLARIYAVGYARIRHARVVTTAMITLYTSVPIVLLLNRKLLKLSSVKLPSSPVNA